VTQPLPPGVPQRFKHYRVVRILGQGGMGSVYEGVDERVGQRVAIKVLHPHLAAADPTFTERFEREAHVAALLRSPYTVHLLDFGRQDDRYYLVMEFIDGQSLSDILRHGPLDANRALWVAGEVARALEEAQARGIVHRDIKPDNILFDSDGRVKVTDFGIARSMNSSGLTVQGGFVGTPAYAAPEQVEGNVDHRSDIYSVGITLFATLTGRPPFEGATPLDTMMQHRMSPLPGQPIAHLPHPVQSIVRRATEKDPLDRYQSAGELAGAIDRARQALSRGGGMAAAPAAPPVVQRPATQAAPPQPARPFQPTDSGPTAIAPQPSQPGGDATVLAPHPPVPSAVATSQQAGGAPPAKKRNVVYFYVAGMAAAIAVAVGIALFLSSGGDDGGGAANGDDTATASASATTAVPVGNAIDYEITAVDRVFDRGTLTAPPNTAVTYTLHNEGQLRHSLQFKDREGGAELATGSTGPIAEGGQTVTVSFTTPGPGTYYFECVNHPGVMNGTFDVKEGAPPPPTTAATTTGTAAATGTASPDQVGVLVVATEFAFDKSEIVVATGSQVGVRLRNDGNAPHSIRFVASAGADALPAATGATIQGGQTDTLGFRAPAPGTYRFECGVHPGQMNGVFRVTDDQAAATNTPLPSVTPPVIAGSKLGSGMAVEVVQAVALRAQPSTQATVVQQLPVGTRLIVVTNTPSASTFHQTEGLLFWRVVIEGTQTVGWVPEMTLNGNTRSLEPAD
jgi:plastocyanin/predicted Ser/Thr protein kinase